MFTVIVTSDASVQFIERYRTLFEPYIDEEKIAICYWNEQGRDIRTALPQLSSLVRDKYEWRCIVALPPYSDIEIQKEAGLYYPASGKNPYDFLCNQEKEPEIKESQVPLIRLAQMLGGVPEPVRSYSFQFVKDENHKAVLRSVPDVEEKQYQKQKEAWKMLEDQYSFECDKPVSLFLLMGRTPYIEEMADLTDCELMSRKETDNSRFWYRNQYPAKARFLIKNCTTYGHAYYKENLFSFWMTVLTLALNEISAGSVEAYKLYHVSASVNRDMVNELFSRYLNRMERLQFQVVHMIEQIKKELQAVNDFEEVSNYAVSVPINYNFALKENMLISSKSIGFAGDCPVPEKKWWSREYERSRESFKRFLWVPRAAVDKGVSFARSCTVMSDEEIYNLSEYQKEQLKGDLGELEAKILSFNMMDTLPAKKFKKEMERTSKAVQASCNKRMTRKSAIISGAIAVTVYMAGYIPDIVNSVILRRGFLKALLLCGGSAAAMTAVVICCLVYFKRKIVVKVADYNEVMKWIKRTVLESAELFQQYLSSVATYMRGKSMLDLLANRTLRASEGIVLLERHQYHLACQINVIQGWLGDFNLAAMPDDGSVIKDYFNVDIPPEENESYYIQSEVEDIFIPETDGSVLKAPYPFITSLDIRREEVFEAL